MMRITRAITTWAGVGLLRPAPGSWGSLAALPLALFLYAIGGALALLLAASLIALLGIWATARETAGLDDPDLSEIVIDEVAGQLLTLLPGAIALQMKAPALIWLPWPLLLFGFALFRLFDILKPGPVGWADRLHSPLGVMLDDLIAGVLAGLCVWLIGAGFHAVVAS